MAVNAKASDRTVGAENGGMTAGGDGFQCARSAGFDQSFTPVDNRTLCFQFIAPVTRILGGDGFLKTLSCDQPSNQDHKRLLRHNLRILSDPLGRSLR